MPRSDQPGRGGWQRWYDGTSIARAIGWSPRWADHLGRYRDFMWKINTGSRQCARFPRALECPCRHLGGGSMASNRSDPRPTYPRLHIEMRRLSDAAILVD